MSYESQPDRFTDVLIIKLADKAIESAVDCALLWDEVETLHEDYPEYKLIVFQL